MFNASCLNAPSNICDLFTKANSKYKHETRFSWSGNYYVQTSRLKKIKVLFPVLELNFGTQFPTNFVNSPKDLLKNIFITYCSLQWKQDYYVEAPILLQKVAKSAPTT